MKNWLKKSFKKKYKDYWNKHDASVPMLEYAQKHIEGLQPLVDRMELLKLIPKNGVVAEIGVDMGDFSELILEHTKPTKLHLVDIWGSQRYHSGKQKLVEDKFSNLLEEGKVQIDLGLSTDVVERFEDNYFDWIYIDTDHTYKTTAQELATYSKKMKPGGIIAGHDYEIGNWNGLAKYGVKEAVTEFCVKNDWKLIYLTFENKGCASFAIQKIGS